MVEVMTLCDTVLRDKISNKWSAIGMVNQIICRGFPARKEQLGVYVRLTDVYEDILLTISLCNPQGLAIIATQQKVRHQPHRRGSEEVGGFLENVVFHEAGRHLVTIHHGAAQIGETRLDVFPVPLPERTEG
jgi:hypothetical protein